MLYLICRADQLPESTYPFALKSGSYYPRIQEADSPEDAIDRGFSPEEYSPARKHRLVVIELGRVYEFETRPIKEYTIQSVQRTKLL